jgi:nucleoid-associated protein Lsr2
MAKQVTVSFVDDLDGTSAADEMVGFTLDGVSYEIDLTTQNSKKLRAAVQPWIDAGRRVGGRRHRTPSASSSSTDRRQAAAIRILGTRQRIRSGEAWANPRRRGRSVSGRTDEPLAISRDSTAKRPHCCQS